MRTTGLSILAAVWAALIAAQAIASPPVPPAAGNSAAPAVAKGGRIVLAASKPGSRLDPHLDVQWEVLDILSAVYDTLVYQDEQGHYVGGLARSWDIAGDGKTYTFHLRDDVTFHDGTRFDAAAVKFNFDRIMALGPRSLKARPLLASFDAAEVIDANTVALRLKQPDGFFLFNLSLPYLGMASPAAVRQWGDQYHLHQSGTGPFRFKEYVVGDHYTLVRNPHYRWAPAVYAQRGSALLEEIHWRFLPEAATRAPALEAGDIDVAFDLVPTDVGRIMRSPGHAVEKAYLTGQSAFWFMNTQLAPTDDVRVRKAILHGTDIAAGVKAIMRGQNPVAYGPLSAATPEYAADLAGLYPYDPPRAKALLDQAGWIDSDGDGIRERGGRPLTLRVSMQSWGQSQPFSVLLQAQLRAIGVAVKLEMMDYATQVAAGRDGQKNLLFMGSSGFSAADALRPYFHSENAERGFAWAKYRDTQLDGWLEAAPTALDPAARVELYRRAQRRIMEQALIVPIYDFVVLIGIDTKVRGLAWRSVGLVPTFYDMYIDERAGAMTRR
jgi:peptide/nickel transport system substrate-binding protein